MSYRNGAYRPTREKFNLKDALVVAVAVDRVQGFVRSGHAIYDHKTKTQHYDNKQICHVTLKSMAGKTIFDHECEIPIVKVTDQDRETADEIYDYFDQQLIMDKLADNLVKIGPDGRQNDYNAQLLAMFSSQEVDTSRGLAMIASLPNSRRTAQKRDDMDEFYNSHRGNGYLGDIKKRLKVDAKVIDVKYIASHGIHLVVAVTPAKQVVKFFLNHNKAKKAKEIPGKDITFIGTVKRHEMNEYTNCQETIFRNVRFPEN